MLRKLLLSMRTWVLGKLYLTPIALNSLVDPDATFVLMHKFSMISMVVMMVLAAVLSVVTNITGSPYIISLVPISLALHVVSVRFNTLNRMVMVATYPALEDILVVDSDGTPVDKNYTLNGVALQLQVDEIVLAFKSSFWVQASKGNALAHNILSYPELGDQLKLTIDDVSALSIIIAITHISHPDIKTVPATDDTGMVVKSITHLKTFISNYCWGMSPEIRNQLFDNMPVDVTSMVFDVDTQLNLFWQDEPKLPWLEIVKRTVYPMVRVFQNKHTPTRIWLPSLPDCKQHSLLISVHQARCMVDTFDTALCDVPDVDELVISPTDPNTLNHMVRYYYGSSFFACTHSDRLHERITYVLKEVHMVAYGTTEITSFDGFYTTESFRGWTAYVN